MKTAAFTSGNIKDDDKVYYDPVDAAPVLDNIAALIEEARRANHDGKTLPRGFVAKLIEKKKPMFPWLTRARITSHMKKLEKKKSSPPPPKTLGNKKDETHAIGAIETPTNTQAWSTTSSLTHASHHDNNNGKRKAVVPSLPPPTAPTNNNPTTEAMAMAMSNQAAPTSATAAAAATAAATNIDIEGAKSTASTTPKKYGRPRGPPTASQRARDERAARPKPTAEELDMAERITVTRVEAAATYCGVKECLKEKGFRMPNGTLAKIIEDCKERNGVPKETVIKPGSIQKRVRVKNFSVEPRYPVKYLVTADYVFSDEEE